VRQGRREGSGLGLTVSKRLVELHGGSMWVRSAPTQGSTFFFSLPLADAVVTRPVDRELEASSRSPVEPHGAVVLVGSGARAARVITRYLDDHRVLVSESADQLRRLTHDHAVDALLFTGGPSAATASALADVPRGALLMYCGLRTELALAQETGVAAYL